MITKEKVKKVHIFQLGSDAKPRRICTCEWQEGMTSAQCEGEDWLVASLQTNGIEDYLGKKQETIFPKDGFRFLQNLQFHFKSGYLSASDVIEEEETTS